MVTEKATQPNELQKPAKPIINPNLLHKQSLSASDRLAVWITEKVGTMRFFFIILLWTVMWLGWNILAPKILQFDPYPAFVLWLFISNMIQIFLMPLIMIGQNLQGRHSEIRAESDFEVNIKAENEIETILKHLENQNQLILTILSKMDEKKN